MQNNLDKIPVSDKLTDVVNDSLAIVKKRHKKTVFYKVIISIGTMAAIFVAIFFLGNINPVLASKLPIIGHIFERVEKDVSYKGDFSSSSEKLPTVTTPDTTNENATFTQTSNGITITISEVYYNSKAMYLAASIENEESFPVDFMKTKNMDDYSLDYDLLNFKSIGKVSFCEQHISPYSIEGKFTDDNTFIGIIRIDISHLTKWPSDEELADAGINSNDFNNDGSYLNEIKKTFPDAGSVIQVPENFTYDFAISNIHADLSETVSTEYTGADGETITMNEPKQKIYEGEWNFHLDVNLDLSKTQVVQINTKNNDGLGISKVEKTPYEITADLIIPSDKQEADYFTVICDENGDLLDFQGEYADTFQIYGRNTNTVFIYICDYFKYMDELKDYYWSEDYNEKKKNKTFAQYLSENSLYNTVVSFQESN